jgi:ankyrin repeat protein
MNINKARSAFSLICAALLMSGLFAAGNLLQAQKQHPSSNNVRQQFPIKMTVEPDDNDLSTFVKVVADALEITPIIIDPDISGTVNIPTWTSLSKADVFDLFTVILGNNNAALGKYKGIYGIMPIKDLILSRKVQLIRKLPEPSTCGEIHDAAKQDDLAKVKALLKDKSELVSSRDGDGRMPLHLAAIYGRKAITELLLTNKAVINAYDNFGYTPLHFAVIFCHKDVSEILLSKKADVNERDSDGWTPLLLAISRRHHKDMVELLLANKANVNERARGGWMPLHLAADFCQKDVVSLLLANGAEVNGKDNNGNTPLHTAAAMGCSDAEILLLSKGADVNAVDKLGITPLHEAVRRGGRNLAELLLGKGADINAKNNDG